MTPLPNQSTWTESILLSSSNLRLRSEVEISESIRNLIIYGIYLDSGTQLIGF